MDTRVEHDKLIRLTALIDALDDSKMVSVDDDGFETDAQFYLVPRGAFDDLVQTARGGE